MSENKEDEVQEGGARIEDLPASDKELTDEERQRGWAYTPQIPINPSSHQSPPEGAQRRSPPPPDPEG